MSTDTYRRAIVETQRAIQRNNAEIAAQLKKLGEHLSYRDAAALADASMTDVHGRIQDLREQLPRSRQQVKRIVQCVGRSEELDEELRGLKAQSAEIEAQNGLLCEQIGQAAFAAYRHEVGPQAGGAGGREEYEEIFGALIRQEEEIEDLESEQERLQTNVRSGNFFRIFKETGRSLYLKGLLSLKKKALSKSFGEAGRRFCDSGLAGAVDDPGVQRSLAPYRENKRKLNTLGRQILKFKDEQAALWEELKGLGAEKSHQRRVRELEASIQRIEESLEDAFEGLGSLFKAKPLKPLSEEPEVARCLRQISRAEKSNVQHRKQIERLEAALQIEQLSRQRQSMEEKVARLEREIRSRQEEIGVLNDQIAETKTQSERLARTRGPEEALLRLAAGGGQKGEEE
jgi:chromosome segregation ATPase